MTDDDYLDPNALARCVAVLDAHDDVVVAYPRVVDVAPEGDVLTTYDGGAGGRAPRPSDRLLWIWGSRSCGEVFGVIRTDALRRTRLIRDYTDSDRTLLGELALVGKIHEESSVRFYRCRHDTQSTSAHPNRWERAEWFNPANRNKVVLSVTRQSLHLVAAVAAARLPVAERMGCFYQIARLIKWSLPAHRGELAWACRRGWQLTRERLRSHRLVPHPRPPRG